MDTLNGKLGEEMSPCFDPEALLDIAEESHTSDGKTSTTLNYVGDKDEITRHSHDTVDLMKLASTGKVC